MARRGEIHDGKETVMSDRPEITSLLRNEGTTWEPFLQPRQGHYHIARRVNAGVRERATWPTHHHRAPTRAPPRPRHLRHIDRSQPASRDPTRAPSKIAFGWIIAMVPVRRPRSLHTVRPIALDGPAQPLQRDKPFFDAPLKFPLVSLELQSQGRRIERALGGQPSLVAKSG